MQILIFLYKKKPIRKFFKYLFKSYCCVFYQYYFERNTLQKYYKNLTIYHLNFHKYSQFRKLFISFQNKIKNQSFFFNFLYHYFSCVLSYFYSIYNYVLFSIQYCQYLAQYFNKVSVIKKYYIIYLNTRYIRFITYQKIITNFIF
ncbi:hypothetical protein IMG5_102020 [Ichthyophthirius multifiliis]|uniref:Transmembrane protein n=1 Tax=Ichthyophthirius multifiliis TaxID=5932 RepID=G0QSL3_ICHMU|nr:hypothetical protein IMG5_102020 [Ichthyophthirius multifiliis]EGR31793.1 hypothetical protein IMG5_102020 [Ichthyophthirius multifiliis]|eukprot:XP_004035279.1 hypothetical protein IMG5_102020 [Ichthyophthirius multifiliis]